MEQDGELMWIIFGYYVHYPVYAASAEDANFPLHCCKHLFAIHKAGFSTDFLMWIRGKLLTLQLINTMWINILNALSTDKGEWIKGGHPPDIH